MNNTSIKVNSIEGFADVADFYILHRKGNDCWVTGKGGRVINGSKQSTNYIQYHFATENGNRPVLQHRLFMIAFVPNPDGKRNLDHIDNNPLNNSLDNLQWMTHKENSVKMVMEKRHNKEAFVEKISLSDIIDIFVKYHKLKLTQEEIARRLGVTYIQVGRILRNQARQGDIKFLKEQGFLDF